MPLLLKDRCIGVFDLESPERDAFNKKHVKLLTLLASEAAVAIENARLYESIRANEARFEKELRLAQRVQMALLPQELPKRLRGVDVAWHFDPARELGGDICDFLSPEPNTLVVVLGDVSGKGVPAALYGAAIGEMVRGRTFRRRLEKNVTHAGRAARRHEPHPPRAQPRGVLLHALLRDVRVQEEDRDVRELGAAVPGEVRQRQGRADRDARRAARFIRRLARTTTSSCRSKPATCSCSARTAFSRRSTRPARSSARGACIDVIERTHALPSKEIVNEVFSAVQQFCGDAPQSDDRTVVVVKINQLGPAKQKVPVGIQTGCRYWVRLHPRNHRLRVRADAAVIVTVIVHVRGGGEVDRAERQEDERLQRADDQAEELNRQRQR